MIDEIHDLTCSIHQLFFTTIVIPLFGIGENEGENPYNDCCDRSNIIEESLSEFSVKSHCQL